MPEICTDRDTSIVSHSDESIAKLLRRQFQRYQEFMALENRGEVLTPSPELYCLKRSFESELHISAPTSRGSVRYEKILSYSRNEPRLGLVKRNLERFLRLGKFHAEGKILNVDGFRLRNLQKWANFPVGAPEDNFPSISSYCNCDCEFCYERGTRETPIFYKLGRKNLSLQEVETRIRYYSPETQKGLVPASYLALEAFVNPRCVEILERIHAVFPQNSIKITTNGSFLTEDVVSRLAKLKPILLMVSLNAATAEMRQLTMRGRPAESAQVAINSFALLRKYEIPTEGSYVPWPTKPLSDLEDTVRHMDKYDVVRARVCMPSFTRFHSKDEPFNTDQYWPEVLSTVQHLREEVRVPIDLIPSSYEFQTSLPIVHGAIKNSPAARAGIRFGDRIVAIDGQEIYTLTEMHGLFAQRAQDGSHQKTVFTVERDGERFDIEVPHPDDITKESYPYRAIDKPGGSRWSNSLGIHYTGGFSLTNIARLFEVCKEHRGKRILLFTSELMEPHFREALAMVEDMVELLDSIELYVENPVHRFWGGNVLIGDLWTVPDLIAHTEQWMEVTGIRPDMVVAASSFLSHGKRDLLGNCYLEFERRLDMELNLIPCSQIIE